MNLFLRLSSCLSWNLQAQHLPLPHHPLIFSSILREDLGTINSFKNDQGHVPHDQAGRSGESERKTEIFPFHLMVVNVLTTVNYGKENFPVKSDLCCWKILNDGAVKAVGCWLRNVTGPRFKQILLKSQGF